MTDICDKWGKIKTESSSSASSNNNNYYYYLNGYNISNKLMP